MRPQQADQMVGVCRFRDVIGCPGFQAGFSVSFHRFCGQSQYGKRSETWIRTDGAHRFVAVHAGQHHVDNYGIDVWRSVQYVDTFTASLGEEDSHLALLEQARQREDIPDVVIDNKYSLSFERGI